MSWGVLNQCPFLGDEPKTSARANGAPSARQSRGDRKW
jgi:hypothetical protein